jgi:hypothetical protein
MQYTLKTVLKTVLLPVLQSVFLKDHSFITTGVVMVAKQLLYGLMSGEKL